jgi:hypothetical protein
MSISPPDALRWPKALSRLARNKPPKNGKGRTLAISARLVEELRSHRLSQAEEFLRVGLKLTNETFAVAQVDGSPIQPGTFTQYRNQTIEKTARLSLP